MLSAQASCLEIHAFFGGEMSPPSFFSRREREEKKKERTEEKEEEVGRGRRSTRSDANIPNHSEFREIA